MKTSLHIRMGITTAALLVVAAPLLFVHADTRSIADRTSVRLPTPVSSPTPIDPPSLPTPQPTSGGITSSTSGSINTGGNIGGNVTTGDGHVEVVEVNMGPTNPPPQPVEVNTGDQGSAPAPAPQCDVSDRRSIGGCPTPPRTR